MKLQIDLNLKKELDIRISLLPSSGSILFCQVSRLSLGPVVGNPAPSCGGQEEGRDEAGRGGGKPVHRLAKMK